jgi:hypothetical protein
LPPYASSLVNLDSHGDATAHYRLLLLPIRLLSITTSTSSFTADHRICCRYVIKEANSDRFDHHWSPYERLCHFCHVKYDYVAKLETMEADAYRLVSHLGLDHKDKAGARHRIPLFNSRQRPFSTTGNKTASTRPLASDGLRSQLLTEFNTLTADEIDRLRDIYASDMNMFGYGWTSSQLLATCQNTTATARSRTCC